ncbi:MAG: ester cyclase [Pseudohongiella sp.]|uniref:ester cyclase n=1 Tax=Pseudohongiella sp. TaxID=1979412 RepID=UPI0034A0497F
MNSSLSAIIKDANAKIIADGMLDDVEKYFTPDYSVNLTNKKLSGGFSTIQSTLSAQMRAFSNIEVKVEILIEGVDRIAWQRTMSATHSGAYKGFPASGQQLIWRDMVVSQIEGGRIKEEWLSTDLAEQLLLSRKSRR